MAGVWKPVASSCHGRNSTLAPNVVERLLFSLLEPMCRVAMSDKHDPVAAAASKRAVEAYQASYLASKFELSRSEALALVQRIGVNRGVLLKHLGEKKKER